MTEENREATLAHLRGVVFVAPEGMTRLPPEAREGAIALEVQRARLDETERDREQGIQSWKITHWATHFGRELPGRWHSQEAAEIAARQLLYILEAPSVWQAIRDDEIYQERRAKIEREAAERQARLDEEEDRKAQERYDQRRERAKARRQRKRLEREWAGILAHAAEEGLAFYGPHLPDPSTGWRKNWRRQWVQLQPKLPPAFR